MTSHLEPIEPGMKSRYPVTCVSPGDLPCVHGYYTMSPLSVDGKYITYFRFSHPRPTRTEPETLKGNVVVANADGSSPRPVCETTGSSNQGAMQQWLGDSHKVVLTNYGPNRSWSIVDVDTGKTENRQGAMRSVSDDGRYIFFQTPETIHVTAESEGKNLTPEEVACRVIEYETDREDVRISVADVLEVHPEADLVRNQHMCFKQTLFSPDGSHLAFVFSNQYYIHLKGPVEERRHEIFMADRDGNNIRHLSSFVSHPSWHPNSKYFTAISRERDGQIVNRLAKGKPRFVLYPVDGSKPVILGLEHDWCGYGHPSFEPITEQYLADEQYGAEGNNVLRLYDLTQMTVEDALEVKYKDHSNISGTHIHPAWSPDGTSLFFSSAHSGIARVYRIDIK